MSARDDPRELRELLFAAIAQRLEGEAWTPMQPAGPGGIGLAFTKPVGDEFAATCEVWVSPPARRPLEVVGVMVGLSYAPLQGLWTLLGEQFRGSLLCAPATSDEALKLADELDRDDDDERLAPRPGALFRIASAQEVPAVADAICELVVSRGVAFAERRADLDVLIREFEDPDDPEFIDIRVPALLAAAGRFPQARDMLDRWHPAPELLPDPQRRTAHQLRRWIDSGGDPALIPSEPPPGSEPQPPPGSPSLRDTWDHVRRRQEAVDAVRESASGRSREELRELLEAELQSRGLQETAAWKEGTLDQFTRTSSEQWRAFAAGLGRIGAGLARAARERKLPDLQQPAALAPPDQAAYALPGSSDRIVVELDHAAVAWFDELGDSLRSILGIAHVRAWLSPASQQGPGERAIAVHIGQRRVGRIPADHLDRYETVIDAAARRGELPVLDAVLTKRETPPRYILEIPAIT